MARIILTTVCKQTVLFTSAHHAHQFSTSKTEVFSGAEFQGMESEGEKTTACEESR